MFSFGEVNCAAKPDAESVKSSEGARKRPSLRSVLLSTAISGSALLPFVGLSSAYAQSDSVLIGEDGDGDESKQAMPSDEIIVTGRVNFLENNAYGATKMGLALRDTPQTVNVVTSDLIDYASIRQFDDYYKLDASGGPIHTLDAFPRNYYRGFLQSGVNAVRLDGFRMPANIQLDLASFDRFEVLKGSISTVYGQSVVGGTLNAVTKLPQNEWAGEFLAEGGSFDAYRFEGDITGPILESDDWSFRLVAAREDQNSFLDFASTAMFVIAPSIRYQPTDNTDFLLKVNWQKHDDVFHFGTSLQVGGMLEPGDADTLDIIIRDGLQLPDIPRSRFTGMPWNDADQDALFIQAQGSHVFENDWTLRGSVQYVDTLVTFNNFWHFGPLDEDGFAYFSYRYANEQDRDSYAAEVNLLGDFELLDQEHSFFLGVDYARLDAEFLFSGLYGDASTPFNIFSPPYDLIGPAPIEEFDFFFFSEDVLELFGVTGQIVLRPTDKITINGGIRYNHDTTAGTDRSAGSLGAIFDAAPSATNDLVFNEITYQAGLLYSLTDSINLYASHGTTFEPSSGRVFSPTDPAGILVPPEEGETTEFGVKARIGDNLDFTLAFFDMDRTNLGFRDLLNPGFVVLLGSQKSRGVEASFQGSLTPSWNVYLSTSYLDAEFRGGILDGLQPSGAPKFGLSVFSSYEFLDGPLDGLTVGAGVVHKSGRETFDTALTTDASIRNGGVQTPVTFDFGAFTEVDARITYNVSDQWQLYVSATNIFNELYYSAAFETLTFGVNANPPRIIRGGVKFSF